MSWLLRRRNKKDRAAELDQMSAILWGRLGPGAKLSDRVKVTYNEEVGKFELTPTGAAWSARYGSAAEVEEYLRNSYDAVAAKMQYDEVFKQDKARKLREPGIEVAFSNPPQKDPRSQ